MYNMSGVLLKDTFHISVLLKAILQTVFFHFNGLHDNRDIVYGKCIHKNMIRAHIRPSENLNEQDASHYHKPGENQCNQRFIVYENCVCVKRACTHECQRGDLTEPEEHVYEEPLDLQHTERNRCQIVWMAISIFLSTGAVGLTVYDICFNDRSLIQCPPANAHNHDVNNTLFCLGCTNLTIQIIKQREACLKLLSITTEGGMHKCCAANATQLTALLELCANLHDGTPETMQKTQGQVIKSTPSSAHRRLLAPPEAGTVRGNFYSGMGTRTLRLDPEYSDPLLEHARRVQVVAEGIVVQFSGLYYVYSSIQYKPSARHAGDSCENQTWRHYVIRLSPNIPDNTGQLIETIHTACGMCLETSGTAFTGGVFHLKQNDLIQVEVSRPSMVEFGSTSTYLGLVMLAVEEQ